MLPGNIALPAMRASFAETRHTVPRKLQPKRRDAAVMLELPGDARIQILVQPAGEATVVAPLAAAQPPVLEERGNGGKRLLQVGAVLGLLFLAFFAGQHTATPPHPGGVAPAR